MGPVHLFDLVSQHNRWLSVRQSLIASNIANANTPGYAARDAVPFAKVLEDAPISMAKTTAGHMEEAPRGATPVETLEGVAWEVLHSGNTVGLEQELVKAGEVRRSFAFNAGILKAYHRMMMASAKG